MTLKEIIKDRNTKFVDVRTVMEFNTGHISSALNIPLDQFHYRYNEIEGLNSTPIVFYCRSGNRSGQAVSYLLQKGIKNIFNGGAMIDLQYQLN